MNSKRRDDVISHESAVPNPRKTIQNLRGSTYTLETAIADLIDNSIEFEATKIDIEVSLGGDLIAILDNGKGMSEETHREAMRLASETRQYSSTDLGRFGTGMKAASLSMARRLTVATKRIKDDRVLVRRLDVDHIESTNDWSVATEVMNPDSLPIRFVRALMDNGGTCLLLEKIDKGFGDKHSAEAIKGQVLSHLSDLEVHLGLVFHRFLDKEGFNDRKVSISINGTPIRPWDPFCLGEDLLMPTMEFDEVEIDLGLNRHITLQGFVLPRQDEFRSKDQHLAAGGPKKWNESQGFYVYRNGRLIRWGGWLKTRSKDEHLKLARLRFDFNADLDELFSVNIAKSQIELPKVLRDKIEPYLKLVTQKANERYRNKSKVQLPQRTPGVSVPARSFRAAELARLIEAALQDDRGTLIKLKKIVSDNNPAMAEMINWRHSN